MNNKEGKDCIALAYYLVYKYAPWIRNKDDVVGEMLLKAVKSDPTFRPEAGASKTTYITQCMKNHLFGMIKVSDRKALDKDYYLGKITRAIEDMTIEEVEGVEELRTLSKGMAFDLFSNILMTNPGRRTIELVLDYSSVNNINPARVFEFALDTKLSDVFVHNLEYSIVMDTRPSKLINMSYIIHNRYLVDAHETKTFQEMAEEVGVTRQRIEQIEKKSIEFLNKNLDRLFEYDYRREDDICDWRYPCRTLLEGSEQDTGAAGETS